jgi:hypothetical protein
MDVWVPIIRFERMRVTHQPPHSARGRRRPTCWQRGSRRRWLCQNRAVVLQAPSTSPSWASPPSVLGWHMVDGGPSHLKPAQSFCRRIHITVMGITPLTEELDSYAATDDKKRKREHLERAIRSSMRGVRLLNPSDVGKLAGQEVHRASPYDQLRYAEDVRQDVAPLFAFLDAECSLVEAMGLSREATRRLRIGLEFAINAVSIQQPSLATLTDKLQGWSAQLEQDLKALEDDKRHRGIVRRLWGVFETLRGFLVVRVNGSHSRWRGAHNRWPKHPCRNRIVTSRWHRTG